MNIALISDVHSNFPALRAVFQEIRSDAPDLIVCAGDIIGYGPHPTECLELVREEADYIVTGNHDRTVKTPELYGSHPTAGPGLEHAAAELSEAQLRWLLNRPDEERIADENVLITHSHPDPSKRGQYVYPEDFQSVGESRDERFLVLGHTHVQAAAEAAGTIVINPGSVGQPRDGDPKAGYAMIETEEGEVDLRRIEYDIDATKTAVMEADLPEQTWQRLRFGE